MSRALRTAATGMVAQQLNIDNISNNLANVNTTGFKRSRAHFEDLLYQTQEGSSLVEGDQSTATQEVQVGRGTRLSAVQRVERQGTLEQTGRPLDLAIEGEGFFRIELENGQFAYTRDGSFQLSQDSTLVTTHGYTVAPGITIPEDAASVTISDAGIVSMSTYSDTSPIEVGQIELARFPNASGLRSLGRNLLAETASSGQPVLGQPNSDGFGYIQQGNLEGSNVEIVQEMVDMITAMRAYEINSKAVKSAEEMSQIANSLVQ